jgi:hypothetical protein
MLISEEAYILLNRPHMRTDTRFHRRRDTHGLRNPREAVVYVKQRDHTKREERQDMPISNRPTTRSPYSNQLRNSRLILNRHFLRMVDDQEIEGHLLRFQFQAKLLL